MKRLFILLAILSLALAYSLPSFIRSEANSLIKRPPIYQKTLSNGLVVLFWENHSAPLSAVYLMIKTGSAWEGEFLGSGISHYLEHLISCGTTKFHSEEYYQNLLKKYCISSNAYTTTDVTVYHQVGPSEHFDIIAGMLYEFVSACAFTQAEVDREKNVILQEIAMNEEEPGDVFWDFVRENYYLVSPYRVPIIGYREQFSKLTRDDILRYYNSRYAPNNAILAIAGDLDTSVVWTVVETLFGKWERKTVTRPFPIDEPLPSTPRFVEGEFDGLGTLAYIGIRFPTIHWGDKDMWALNILGEILSGTDGARLDMELVSKLNLMTSVYAYHDIDPFQRGCFVIGGRFEYQNRDKMIEAMLEALDQVKSKGITKRELDEAKTMIFQRIRKISEGVEQQANEILYNFFIDGNPWTSDIEWAHYNALTVEDVNRVARKYLNQNTMIVTILKQKGLTISNDKSLLTGHKQDKSEFKLAKLPNGIQAVVAENQDASHCNIAIYVLGGSAYEPNGMEGLAKFTARYLREGTKRFPNFEALSGKLSQLGLTISIESGTHTIYLSCEFFPEQFSDVLSILDEICFSPTFPPQATTKLIAQQLSEINARNAHWLRDAIDFFRQRFYGKHPYGHNETGFAESVTKFTESDARRFWEERLNPQSIVIGFSGPMDESKVIHELTRVFGKRKLKSREHQKIPLASTHSEPERHEKTAPRKQVTLIVAYDAPPMNHPDQPSMEVADNILSGVGLSGWLFEELRSKRDFVYTVWSSYSPRVSGGEFVIATQFEPQNFDTVYSVIISLVEKLKNGKFSEDELKQAKLAATQARIEKNQFQKNRVSDIALDVLYGLGLDYEEKYLENLKSITSADVKEVAQKYFRNPVVVVINPDR